MQQHDRTWISSLHFVGRSVIQINQGIDLDKNVSAGQVTKLRKLLFFKEKPLYHLPLMPFVKMPHFIAFYQGSYIDNLLGPISINATFSHFFSSLLSRPRIIEWFTGSEEGKVTPEIVRRDYHAVIRDTLRWINDWPTSYDVGPAIIQRWVSYPPQLPDS